MCLAGATQEGRVQDTRSGELAVRPPGHAETPTAWEAISSSSTSAAHRSAAMAGGARPDPFRTRKLSRRAPMVLRGQPVGEQGAADRWTALDPHPAGSGAGAPRGDPPAAPPLFIRAFRPFCSMTRISRVAFRPRGLFALRQICFKLPTSTLYCSSALFPKSQLRPGWPYLHGADRLCGLFHPTAEVT